MTETRTRSGLPAIAIATVVAGLAGYVVTWVVFRGVGAVDYAVFAVYWSATYLIVGALSGIQQEITRGTHSRSAGETANPPVARNFAVVAAAVVLVIVLALTPIWVALVFPEPGGAWLVVPLAFGCASYVIVAVVAGTFYGIQLWVPLAWMIVLDGLLRLAAIAVLVLIAPDAVSLAWAVALPFPIAVVIVWLVARGRVVGRSRLDVAMRPLVWNVSRTVVAAASTGILISGFPLALKLTSPVEGAARLGVVILAVTLVRAPLIVGAMSLQSYLIVAFRRPNPVGRRVAIVAAVIVGGGALLAVLGAWLGPVLFLQLFGSEAVMDAGLIALLVASSSLVAAMFVTGPLLLTRSGHFAYTAGWLTAAAVTIVTLLLPLEFEVRVVLSLLGGPLAGLLVHLGGLVMLRRTEVTRVAP